MTITPYSRTMCSPVPTTSPCPFRPMKTVKEADRVMNEAQVLYKKYEHIMEPGDRIVAGDRMTL